MAGKGLSTQQEVRIVALLARGLSYEKIKQDFVSRGDWVSHRTILAVKKRNAENLRDIKDKLLKIELADAQSLHDKSHNLLKSKLDKAQDDIEETGDTKLSVSELIAVSKEMHTQTLKTPEAAGNHSQEDLQALVKALQSQDSVTLERLIFNAEPGNGEATHRKTVLSSTEGGDILSGEAPSN